MGRFPARPKRYYHVSTVRFNPQTVMGSWTFATNTKKNAWKHAIPYIMEKFDIVQEEIDKARHYTQDGFYYVDIFLKGRVPLCFTIGHSITGSRCSLN